MPGPDQREERIFSDALALPPAERRRFVDEACAGDPSLARRVRELLQAHDSAGDFMSGSPAASAGGTRSSAPDSVAGGESPGSRIGRYRLLQKLGEGGCGIVWMAEQTEPVHRRVALKIVKPGMDTREVIARFESERQALAMMDHPNIAQVLDAGATGSGRPFFVMELVHGIRITDHCDRHNLSIGERLAIFAQVCHAVQHAHQKGVIHRDLKPSNILVATLDGAPVPKVIDFGIAKATQGRLTDRTLFTAFEQFMGTPAYMSPEQTELSPVDIDTRSDIYSLGVLLYELLTGRPPFDPRTLMQAGLDEIRRIIREVDPPKPSSNVSTLADADRAAVARLHGTEPGRLPAELRGDLDWIVMKALEKDRTRRYETAVALAEDLQRHLRHEPVTAGPPSRSYRFAKFIRRHRLAFAAAAAVALALVGGIVASTWQAVRAARAERIARAERARTEELLAFMIGDLRAQLARVGRLDVLEGVGDRALAHFASRQPGELDDRELARHARALTQIGEIRMAQFRYPEAQTAFAEAHARAAALADRHPGDGALLFERGQAEYWIGFVHWKRGDLAAATRWLTRYDATSRSLTALDPSRSEWQSELAHGRHNLAVLAKEQGRVAAARAGFLEEAAILERLGAAAPADTDLQARLADAHSWLGGLAEQTGDFAEAAGRYGERAAIFGRLATADPRTPRWRFRLADALLFQTDVQLATGRADEAGVLLDRAVRLLDEVVALDPANRRWQSVALFARLRSAMLLAHGGDSAGAAQLLDCLRPDLETLVAAEPSDRGNLRKLAAAWRLETGLRDAAGRTDAAVAAARTVELVERLLCDGPVSGADAGECAHALIAAGRTAAHAGDAAAARRHWQRAAELLAPLLPDSRDWRLLDPAARAAAALGRTAEAQALVRRLDFLGYIPLDPWPDTLRPDAADHPTHPNP